MKRILMLNYEFPPLGGGGGVAAFKLAKGFIKQGYQVDYVTSGYKGLEKFEIVDGINVYRTKTIGRKGLQTASFICMLSYVVTGFLKAFYLCKNHEYEFINTQFVIPTGPIGYLLSRMFKLKNILSLHGGDIYDPSKKMSPHNHWYWKVVVKFLLNRADVLVAQSSNTKKNTIAFYEPNKEVYIIPLAYELHSFEKVSRQELGLDASKKYLISVGRLVSRKGYKYLVEALSLIKDENVECLIISDGPEKESLLKLAQELGVDHRLHLLGRLPTEEKKFQYLSAADIYVLSSLHEGFGIVLQEAMQVGLPIIATNHGGQVDLVEDGVNGFLIEPSEAKAIAEKCEEMFASENEMKSFGRKNQHLVHNFAIEAVASDYLKLFEPDSTRFAGTGI